MPRGEKATNTGNKRPRARKIAESMMRRGATRASANTIANAAMDREYSRVRTGNARKARSSFDEEAHDSRSGQRKTNLTTKAPAVSGAGKPGTARRPDSSKRTVKQSGRAGGTASGRRPRPSADPATGASARQSTAARRPPRPRKAAGAKRRSGREI
jgi:hypothetical protein